MEILWRTSGIEGHEYTLRAEVDTVRFARLPWGPRLPVGPPQGPAVSGMLAAYAGTVKLIALKMLFPSMKFSIIAAHEKLPKGQHPGAFGSVQTLWLGKMLVDW